MSAKPPRRLLFVDHVRRILGGAEVNLIELLAEPAAREGWEVEVACDPQGRLHEALPSAGITRRDFAFDDALGTLRVVGRRFPLAAMIRSLRALSRARQDLARWVAAIRPEAVISCTNKDHFAAWPACRRAGIPSVWWVNDILSPDFFPWPARRAFSMQGRRGATRMIAVSEFARLALLRESLPANRVVTIHNGIPLQRYRRQAGGALRQLLSVPEGEALVGVVGRYTPWKGQDLFVRLAEAWCRESAKGRFALIGHAFNEDQGFEASLRDFIRSRGLVERVHLVPFQHDIAAALSDLDLLVHTSIKPEPFGRVIIEAMAVGVPVIAARGGGVPEIIVHGQNGLLAKPGDLGDYGVQLRTILTDPGLRETLRQAGVQTVADRFSVTRVRSQFEDLLDQCAS